jgi:hypothetical protein
VRGRSNQRATVVALLTLLTTLVLVPGTTARAQTQRTAETGSTDVDDRWIPSFSFEGSAYVQQMRSSLSSKCLEGRPANDLSRRPSCRDPDAIFNDLVEDANGNVVVVEPYLPGGDPNPLYAFGEATLRDADDGDEVTVTPMVGANLQLMTPRMDFIPGGPRAFVTGELLTFWAGERDIAREGSPTGVAFPDPAEAGATTQNSIRFSQRGLFGVGSRVRSEVQTLGWGARAGLAFPFQFRERRMWLKPSFGWIQYEVDVEAIVVAGLKDDGLFSGGSADQIPPDVQNDGAGNFSQRGPGIRAVTLLGNDTETINGIGPGVELEMEAGRFGPLGVSLFFSMQMFRMLGSTKIDLNSSRRCDANVSPCLSNLVNTGPEAGRIPIVYPLPPPIPPEFVPVPSPAGPVPTVGVSYPCPDPGGDCSDPAAFPDPLAPVFPFGADTYTASWEFDVQDWGYRGGIGIRLHWLGR